MDQELVQYLDERFGRIEQQLDGHDRRFESMDRRFESMDRRFERIDRRFDDMNERIRHNGVLIEGVRDELHLVAEGLIMHIEVRHREDREYFDRKFEDMSALFRSSHGHLQQQQDQLRQSQDQIRQRVENLERNQN